MTGRGETIAVALMPVTVALAMLAGVGAVAVAIHVVGGFDPPRLIRVGAIDCIATGERLWCGCDERGREVKP